LRGQAIRCPNTLCRNVFTVGEAGPAPAAPGGPPAPAAPSPPNGQLSGSVGDLVPILPAEEVIEPTESAPPGRTSERGGDQVPLVEAEVVDAEVMDVVVEAPQEAPSWHQPPPVRRAPAAARPAAPSAPARPPQHETVPDQPRDLAAATWEPPVRRPRYRAEEAAAPALEHPAPEPAPHVEEPVAPRRRRRARLAAVAVILLAAAVLAGAGWFFWTAFRQTEAELAGKADEAYQAGQFGSAAEQYQLLADKFLGSDGVDNYRFRRQLSELRARVAARDGNPAELLDQLKQFIEANKESPFLRPHARDLGQTLVKLAEDFAEGQGNPTGREPLAVVDRAQTILTLVARLDKDPFPPDGPTRIRKAFDRVRLAVDRWERHDKALKDLRELVRRPPADAIRAAQRLVKEKREDFPGLSQEPEVAQILEALYDRHLASVTYVPGGEGADGPSAPKDVGPSLLFDPVVPDAPSGSPGDDAVVLALARGVLYGLKRGNGVVKWAMRVGIDTTTLPVRVPARAANRERILVLSADTETLTALDTDGNPLWRYRLSKPCLGRPLVVDQRAYLACYDGQVHEVELAEGRLVGRYQLGQRLTTGGAREPGTRRLYFPADDSCVYVLDADQHSCQAILYSGHPSGSLRSEPLIIPPEGEAPGYLILNQTQGLDAMQLRVFQLPLAPDRGMARRAAPLPLDPPPRVAGWSWFRPYHDSEKVVLLSDAGRLGLFGVRQARNPLDPHLFPLLQPDGIDLTPFLSPPTRARSRSQVVQVQGDDFWVLASGRLQRLQLAWSERSGPQPVTAWAKPLDLGSPLHDPQFDADRRTGRARLFLVTQPLRRQTCLATAVDDETGDILWQRQLGLVCQGDPLLLWPDPKAPPLGAGTPLVLALDQGGGLFALDPLRFPAEAGAQWQSGGQRVLLASALDDNPAAPPVLLPGPDGRSAYQVASPGEGQELVVRYVHCAEDGRRLLVSERRSPLTAALAGTPAVAGPWLVLPLRDGTLGRLPLPLPPELREPERVADWRSKRAGPEARGHVLALGGNRFLTTDGGRALTCWVWKGLSWHSLPENRDDAEAPTLEMKDRVVAPPLRLPGAPPRVCVADSAGVLTLLRVQEDGQLGVQRAWRLGGRITAGPFLRSQDGAVRIGCVVDQSRLVWIDPARRDPLWEYRTGGGEPVVGEPAPAEGLVVVADQSGRVVGLDPATGRPEGPGYTLRASVVPAASPVSFGPGRLFTPLSDGTALLLSVDRLRHPLRHFPLVW
jgi:outer membrane protein assembly factor BamB